MKVSRQAPRGLFERCVRRRAVSDSRHALIPLVLLAFASAGLAAITQQPTYSGPLSAPAAPPNTALILGRVVDSETGRPIADAIIGLGAGEMLLRDLTALGLPQSAPFRRVVSDRDGRFVFRNVPAGQYRFATSAAGYLSGAYGQLRAQGTAQAFVLGPGEKAANVVLRMWKASTISGTVTDEAGDPVVGVRVNLVRRSRSNGKWLTNVYASARTDDRGMYRMAGNLPSLYYVYVPSTISSAPQRMAETAAVLSAVGLFSGVVESAAGFSSVGMAGGGGVIEAGDSFIQLGSSNSYALPPTVTADGRVFGYPTTFHPNALTSARATAIMLEAGEDRTGVDIQVRPVQLVRISGTVTGPSGPERNLPLRLVSSEVDAVGGGGNGLFETAATFTDTAGLFSFAAVPPGQFTIKAVRMNQASPAAAAADGSLRAAPLQTLWVDTPVAVADSHVSGLQLHMQKGIAVSGRVVFEGVGAAQPSRQAVSQMQTVRFSLSAADGRAIPCCPSVQVGPSGEFRTEGYAPGGYYPTVTNLPDWHLKSITGGGRDIMRSPLTVGSDAIEDVVVTYTQQESSIEGRVVTRAGAIDSSAAVVVFPMEYQTMAAGVNLRIVRFSRPTPQTGMFSVPSVVPGDYLIAAVPDGDVPNWRDTKAIEGLVQFATRVTVAPGERKVVTLTRGDLP
jgi:protocatechuate 3,4-dioxygenase beta subunit